jgi:hypothetical protein
MSGRISGPLGGGNSRTLRACVAAPTGPRAPFAGVGPALFDGVCGLGSWLSALAPELGATRRWVGTEPEARQQAVPGLLLAASFAPWSSASATFAAAAPWQAAEPGPAGGRAPSGSTRWSGEDRPRVQHSRWRERTRRRQEAVRGAAAPTAVPRKDTLLVATLQVLPYHDPRAAIVVGIAAV